MGKKIVRIIIPIICVFVILSAMAAWIGGDIILDYGRYFAVDEAGQVYLGVGEYIYIYDDSSPVSKFLVGRGINFTIVDDEIIAYNGEHTIHYTLDGAENSREQGRADTVYRQYRYISGDGTEYRIRYPLGRFSIFAENSNMPIYQMPLRDYSFGISAIIALSVLAVWCCYMAIQFLKE